MVWPVTSLFLRQLLSFPLQVLSQMPSGRVAVGHAYEDYAHSLIERIGRGDNRRRWTPVRSLSIKQEGVGRSGELDSVLWRDAVAIVLEHKAGNLVLTVGGRKTLRNALGPSDEDVAMFPAIPKKDTGAITHGIWQLAGTANAVSSALCARFGVAPRRVLPTISTLQPFQIDHWVRVAYLDLLPSEAGVTFPSTWSKLDWIDVAGLEALAQLGDDGRLDLLDILEGRTRSSQRFVEYLADRFDGVPPDTKLFPIAPELMQEAEQHYFERDLHQLTPPSQ
jgi:hypothetical protein